MRRVLEERPWIILVAWIIIVMVAASYAVRVDEVVETSQQEFLPPTAESIKAMEKIAKELPDIGEAGGSPDFMAVLHGAPVSLDTYRKIGDWYLGDYKNTAPASSYTWIDIVADAEERIKEGMVQAIQGSLAAVQGMIQLSSAYNDTLENVNMTASLVEAADGLYATIYSLGEGMEESTPGLRQLQQGIVQVCTDITPAIVYTYYNITRAEALLETQTQAYQRGSLTREDIAIVIAASSQSSLGALDPGIVALVYNYTLSIGGPQSWSNSAGAELAYRILNTTMPREAAPLLEAAKQAWLEAVANDTDHRSIVAGNPTVGQDLLLERIDALLVKAKELAALNAVQILTEDMPEDGAALARIVGLNTVKAGCTPKGLDKVLLDSMTGFLIEVGIPEDAARLIALKALEGNFTSQDAAQIAVDILKSQAPANASILDTIPQVLVERDPEANGSLTGTTAIGIAASLITSSLGGDLDGVSSLEEASYKIMRLALGNQSEAQLLDRLWEMGLLGKPARDVALGSVDLIAGSIAERGDLDEDEARLIAEAAVKVYTGEASLDEEAERLASIKLEEIFPEIIEGLRGLMVEKDLEGFIVILDPSGASLEERVENAREAASLLEAGLKAAGYSVDTGLGGQAVMEYEVREAAMRDVERSDRLSIIFVVTILALVLESLAAVFLPFIGIGFGIILSLAAAFILAKQGIIDVTTQSRTIMFTTGLGLGVDYAAYVAKRFREAMQQGLDPRRAAAEAYARSRRPVIAGALTASIGFGSMMLARDFPFIASIGSNVPLTILAVMLASITFIPALLAYVGSKRWFWWPRHPTDSRKGDRLLPLGRSISMRPLVPLAFVVLVTLLSAWVAAGFEGSYDIALNLPPDTSSRKALEMINTYYDPGTIYPIYIAASSPGKAQEVADAISSLQCIASANRVSNTSIVKAVSAINPVSSEGVKCAEQVREEAHRVDPGSLVGGLPAMNLDFRDLINQVFYGRVYPVALALMFLTMLVAYGGVLTAAAAVLSVGLAALWGSSLTVLLYQNVLGSEVIWYLPVIVFTAILGVGMDYNSFYLARAREECMRECSRDAVAWSIARGTPIVIGLSAIMAGAYLGLTLASSPGLSQMGMALVLGVLAAGLNAALILTPPAIALLQRLAWWPSRR